MDPEAALIAIAFAASGGDDRCEDVIVQSADTVAVLDGASSWASPGSGGRYARALSAALLRSFGGADLVQILVAAIESAGPARGDGSSTVQLARITATTVDLLALGDGTTVVEFHDGRVEVLTDDRIARFGREYRNAYRRLLRAGDGFGEQHRALLAALQAEQRRHRNRRGGYWIAAGEPEAAEQACSRSFPADQVSAVLVLSDGAAAAVTRFGCLPDWSAALALVRESGPESLLALAGKAEDSDPRGHRWPRSRARDDKAAALLSSLRRSATSGWYASPTARDQGRG